MEDSQHYCNSAYKWTTIKIITKKYSSPRERDAGFSDSIWSKCICIYNHRNWIDMVFIGRLLEGSLSMKKKSVFCLNFITEHLGKSVAFWKSIFLTDETMIEMFGHNQNCHVWRKANNAYQVKNLVPIMKDDGKILRSGLLFCLKIWVTPYYPRKHEFLVLSTISGSESAMNERVEAW